MLGQQCARVRGIVELRQIHGCASESAAEAGGSGADGARGGVLRDRSRQGRRRVPAADVQTRTAVRAQHHAGERDETGSAAGVVAERTAAGSRPWIPAAADYAGLVWGGEREMAVGNSPAGGAV